MATNGAKALMDQKARARLEAATDELVKEFGIERPAVRGVIRDRDLLAIAQLEDFATLLERLADASKAKPEPKVEEPKDEPKADEPAKEADSGRQTESRNTGRQAPVRQQGPKGKGR